MTPAQIQAAERRFRRELTDEAPPDRRVDQDKGDDDTGVDHQQEGDRG